MEDAPKLLKIPKSECPDIWIRLPRHKWPKLLSGMEDTALLLQRNLYGHSLAGRSSERQFEKILLKYFQFGMLVRQRRKENIFNCARGRYQTGWKETEHQSDLENNHERRSFGSINIIC